MPENDSQVTPPPGAEAEVAIVVTDALPALRASGEAALLQEVDVEALTAALRYLQQHMPDLVQLSLRERQKKANAANLDPAIIDRGLDLAAAWPNMKNALGVSAAELRADLDRAGRNEELRQVMLALADTLKATNLALKHRTGTTILQVYAIVGSGLRSRVPDDYSHLRPQYEAMKRAILQVRKKQSRKRAKDAEPDPGEE